MRDCSACGGTQAPTDVDTGLCYFCEQNALTSRLTVLWHTDREKFHALWAKVRPEWPEDDRRRNEEKEKAK